MLISLLLVFIMIPGLAFFYAGYVRSHNSVSTILKTMIVFGPCALLWPVIGNSLVFGEDIRGVIGWSGDLFLQDLVQVSVERGLFSLYQLLFSIISVAVITGAIVERVKFSFWLIFAPLWIILIYYPVAHWVWNKNGWIAQLGGLDFAGGLVVHVTSGFSALIFAKMLGRREDFFKLKKSYNIGLVFVGVTLIWLGWFGFNGGSALAFDEVAITAVINTFVASSSAVTAWLILDYIFTPHRLYAKGVAASILCGLVAITPSAGHVTMYNAILIGAVVAFLCNFMMRYFHSVVKIDDSLDVFISHGMAGAIGAVLTGLFAKINLLNKEIDTSILLKANVIGTISVSIYAMVMTWLILKVLSRFMEMRVLPEHEKEGLDVSMHGENILVITKNG